uniref:Uncharacterized protein n=1 Tax=Rhizochromulina marina TaxID=1034831 RepID=A0A7S2WQG4_9STRA|mmetsp:Transcript_30234/g.88058  ORF Transcript_30234/g.88058 Transcript_30234/m.88058 type:complete len:213 (+) Transcript_30234:258-896(+)
MSCPGGQVRGASESSRSRNTDVGGVRRGCRSRFGFVLGPAQVGGNYGVDKLSGAGREPVQERELAGQECAGVKARERTVLGVTITKATGRGGVRYCGADWGRAPVVVCGPGTRSPQPGVDEFRRGTASEELEHRGQAAGWGNAGSTTMKVVGRRCGRTKRVERRKLKRSARCGDGPMSGSEEPENRWAKATEETAFAMRAAERAAGRGKRGQ